MADTAGPNETTTISHLLAWIAVRADGEDIIVAIFDGVAAPLIATNMMEANKMRGQALAYRDNHNVVVKLIEWTVRRIIEELGQ